MKSIVTLRSGLLALALFVTVLLPAFTHAADSATASATETAKETTEQAKAAMGDLGKKMSEHRLVNRTPAEIVAWVIMGVLVGALVGITSPYQASLPGRFLVLGFGLLGAFIGSMVARVGELDFGWPAIQITGEELACSFGGALFLVILGRFIRYKINKTREHLTTKKKEPQP
jgi:uncharacterized membrane protein YeaQ/YmgE (transglycosylase-associated protein family)